MSRTATLGASLALAAVVAAGCQGSPRLSSDGTRPVDLSTTVVHTSFAPALIPQDTGGISSSPIQQTAASEQAVAPGEPGAPPAAKKLASEPAPVAAGPDELGLNEAIETSLTQNPDLRILRQTEGVGAAVLGVARTYPFNPTVQTRILPYAKLPKGIDGPVYSYVLLWQQFEVAHQRRFRRDNAAALLNGIRWTIQQAELQNTALTEQLFFAGLYQQGLRELADMTARLNDELLSVLEKRLTAGRAAAADVAMTRIDTATSHQQARLAAINFENALRALRRQLNLPPDFPLKLSGDLTGFTWHAVSSQELCQLMGQQSDFATATTRDGLVAELAAGRPDVLAARSNYEASGANVRLARASRVPNLWFGPFYSRDSEAIVNVGFQGQMDIPVVNTGKPLVRQREAELVQQRTNYEQLEAKARIETRTALERYEQARAMCEQIRKETTQQLPEELQKLETEFKKQEIDILRIFQARNSLIQLRRTYLDSLNELALAAAAVTAAAGLPPAALVSRPCANAQLLTPCSLPPAALEGGASEHELVR
jgi:outer membrane protein TolC